MGSVIEFLQVKRESLERSIGLLKHELVSLKDQYNVTEEEYKEKCEALEDVDAALEKLSGV